MSSDLEKAPGYISRYTSYTAIFYGGVIAFIMLWLWKTFHGMDGLVFIDSLAELIGLASVFSMIRLCATGEFGKGVSTSIIFALMVVAIAISSITEVIESDEVKLEATQQVLIDVTKAAMSTIEDTAKQVEEDQNQNQDDSTTCPSDEDSSKDNKI